MANIYCLISDEPFLLQENRLIEINKLKKEGYLNRKIFFADKKFNWDTFDSNDSLSLFEDKELLDISCLLYTSPSPRDVKRSRMPSSA